MKPKLGRGLVISLVTFILAILFVEVMLRLFTDVDPKYYDNAGSQRILMPEHDNPQDNPFGLPLGMRVTKPGVVTKLCGSRVEINRQGMRSDREFALEKPDGNYRVMLIGDSVTFSNTAFDDSIGEQLRGDLERRLAGTEVEVPSFACPGWSFPSYTTILHHAASRFEMDHLVVNFVMNDLPVGNHPFEPLIQPRVPEKRRHPIVRFFFGESTFGQGGPVLRFIYTNSAFGARLGWWLKGFRAKVVPMDPTLLSMLQPDEELWRAVEKLRPAFRYLRGLCDEHALPCTIFLWPYAVQLDAEIGRHVFEGWFGKSFDPDILSGRPQAMVMRLCEAEGLECIDLLESYREDGRGRDLYFHTPEGRLDYMHYSRAGNGIGARRIADRLLVGRASEAP